METVGAKKYQNLILLMVSMIGGFFIPLAGIGINVFLLVSGNRANVPLTQEEKTMSIIALTVLTIFYIVSLLYNMQFGMPDATPSETLIRLIFI